MTTFHHGIKVNDVPAGTRQIQSLSSSIIGIVGTAPDADPDLFPENEPVLVISRKEAAGLDTVGSRAGTLPQALTDIFDQTGATIVVIRVEEGATESETITNIIGGVNTEGRNEGIQVLMDAQPVLGLKPRLLIAPGFTNQKSVVDALIAVAEKLRGIVAADGPNTTRSDAINYAGDFGSDRLYIVDPYIKKLVNGAYVDTPNSASVAGLIAKTDYNYGVHYSPSNHVLLGVTGTARPISFINGDPDSEANLLNAENIATIIRRDGYRLWGNRTTSSDKRYAFLSVRRVSDLIADAIENSLLDVVDSPVNKQLFESIVDSVNAYLRTLVSEGVILGGECWYEREDNSNSDLAAGKVRFKYNFTVPPPAEDMQFDAMLVEDYFETIFE